MAKVKGNADLVLVLSTFLDNLVPSLPLGLRFVPLAAVAKAKQHQD